MRKTVNVFIIIMVLFLSVLLVSCGDEIIAGSDNDSPAPSEPEDGKTIITEVHITVDTKNYNGSTTESNYALRVYTDTYHNYIYSELTSNTNYRFSNSTIVYVNGKQVHNVITFNEDYTVLTYRMDDSNWSPIV